MRLLLAALVLVPSLAWGQGTEPPASAPGAINPAVTQANIAATICKSGWTATVRPPVSYTNALKKKLMAEQGIPWSKAGTLELDHRVPLEAGGNPTDPKNLWIQQWLGPQGAHKKDALESSVKRAICSHKITLEQGQAIFLGDWRANLKP